MTAARDNEVLGNRSVRFRSVVLCDWAMGKRVLTARSSAVSATLCGPAKAPGDELPKDSGDARVGKKAAKAVQKTMVHQMASAQRAVKPLGVMRGKSRTSKSAPKAPGMSAVIRKRRPDTQRQRWRRRKPSTLGWPSIAAKKGQMYRHGYTCNAAPRIKATALAFVIRRGSKSMPTSKDRCTRSADFTRALTVWQ